MLLVSEKESGLAVFSQAQACPGSRLKAQVQLELINGFIPALLSRQEENQNFCAKKHIPEKQNEHFVILKSATRHRSFGPKFFSQPRPLNRSRNIGLAPKFSGNYSAAASPRPKTFFFSVEPAPKIFRAPGLLLPICHSNVGSE